MASATRRAALGAGLLAIPASGALAAANAPASRPPLDQDARITTPSDAIARTTSGQVQGFKKGPVFVFRGVPYGADTSSARRFLPPQPAPSWQGVRHCVNFGPVCPTPFPPRSSEELSFMTDWVFGYPGEDCLRLNVWSTNLGAASRKPVMVWLHGGGFIGGNAQDIPAYDGAALARRGVVVVSVNHRLGALGFCDLSEQGGDAYAASGNAGMLDLVLALKWVSENIAAFGGDPGRVTIFGHSGGGGKVSTLMGMPSAHGLFHKAIVMSGSFRPTIEPALSRTMARMMVANLGVKAGDVTALQALPAQRLIEAGFAAAGRLAREGTPVPLGGWAPVFDSTVVTQDWKDGAPPMSAHIPMIVGSVRDEIRPADLPASDADLLALAERLKPGAGRQVADAVRRAYPGLAPRDLGAVLNGMTSGSGRLSALGQAAKQTAAGGRAFSYWFTWAAPLFDGRQGVPHGCDLAEAFDNVARYEHMTGNAPEAHHIAGLMSQAFVNFAERSDPSQPGLAWPPFDNAAPTMVFDSRVQVVADPLGEVRRLLA